MQELFSELGDLKRFSINYDRSGRSKVQIYLMVFYLSCMHLIPVSLTYAVPLTSQGTAEVVFARRSDAVAAVKKYNNVQLDGKPMKIEIVGTNTPTAAAALPVSNGGHARNAARRYISHLIIHPELPVHADISCRGMFGSILFILISIVSKNSSPVQFQLISVSLTWQIN